ncbi:MAG: hypothetical protein ACW967_00175 [Candidatus Hodarchaeales archaeon]|jgi:hypothetical protein
MNNNIKNFLNSISSTSSDTISVKKDEIATEFLKDIVSDLFIDNIKYSIKKFSSDNFSLNKYDKGTIIKFIKYLEKYLDADGEDFRYFSIFLLHHDEEIRDIALNTLSNLIERKITFSPAIYEIILSSILVDVEQKTSQKFSIFLAKNGNVRLIDYLVENLYYEIYLKEEALRDDKERIKKLIKKDENQYLKEWERDARYKLMLGEKITTMVASADCGEYQDALLEGKGVIEFTTCIKALIEFGDDLYLPSLTGLMNRTGNETHLKWLKLLSVIQGNKDYLKDLSTIVNETEDEKFANYTNQKLREKSINI